MSAAARTPARDDPAEASSDRDLDPAITRFGNGIGRLHQQIGLPVRADVDQTGGNSRFDQPAANRVRTPETELVVAGVRSGGVGVTDDGDVGKWPIADGVE